MKEPPNRERNNSVGRDSPLNGVFGEKSRYHSLTARSFGNPVLSAGQIQIRGYLIIAAMLFSLELLLGIGLIGIMGGLAGATTAIVSAEGLPTLRRKVQVATMFLLVVFATFGWLTLNIWIAKHNATPIIAACKRFRSDNGRYPSDLKKLIPKVLPSLPRARSTLAARQFVYDSDRPKLCFVAMFHGVFCYDFRSGNWTTNE